MSFLLSALRPLAYLSLPLVLLDRVSPTARYYVRAGVFATVFFVWGTCSGLIAAAMTLVGNGINSNWVAARGFYVLSSTIFGIRVVVEDEAHMDARPAVLMSNHQSMLDMLVLGRLMPRAAGIVAKRSLQYTPLGPFMTLAHAVFIDRGNSARAVAAVAAAGETARRRGLALWLYPEGTRHSAPALDLLPLKKGGFHLAVQAGIPIVPVVTANYWPIYHAGHFGSGVIRVRVLPPVDTTGLTPADVPALATRVRDMMVQALREISDQPEGAAAADDVAAAAAAAAVVSAPKAEDPPLEAPVPVDARVPVPAPAPAAGAGAGESSGESLAAGAAAPAPKYAASEGGTETEEDEGMVLVGRPA